MDKDTKTQRDIDYLFDMSREIKHMYEIPVIFITKKDFSENIFKVMCNSRSVFNEDSKSRIIDIVVDLHLQWLHAITELENFKRRLSCLPREEIYQAVSYTIDAMAYRLKLYQKFMERNRLLLPNAQQANLMMDLEIVEEMHKHTTNFLLDKLKCFRNYASDYEFQINLKQTLEDLLYWLDEVNDGISRMLSKYMNALSLTLDLTKPLQQIIVEIKTKETPFYKEILMHLNRKGEVFVSMVRCIVPHSLEISKLEEKIAVLEDRLKLFENEPNSPPFLALKHNQNYLEQTLNSIKKSKMSLKNLYEYIDNKIYDNNIEDTDLCICEDYFQLRIFNHLLPSENREHLVTELCYLWDLAIFGEQSHKSVISILSAADMKEKYTDEVGVFYIDEHSRKIYKLEDDDTLYQPNEHNKLVPLSDDAEHSYFYDECGRYYIESKTRERIYKAHAVASEYIMDSSGVLLKLKEVRDGVTYYYDNYGRYYITNEGKHIYREEDSVSEYENDGLGNLVRIRSHSDIFERCPDDANVTEDFKYLKQNIGLALRKCIADCIIHQPSDPIKYLSAALQKYRENIELKENRTREQDALNVERQIIMEENRAAAERAAMEAALLVQGGSETSFDSNFIKYTSNMGHESHENRDTVAAKYN